MKNKIYLLLVFFLAVSFLFTACSSYETIRSRWNAICPNWEHEVELIIEDGALTPYYVLYPSGEVVKIPVDTCVLIRVK